MPVTTGTRLGPYAIIAPLGVGGTGEVYRAKDTKLNRDVAIKTSANGWRSDSREKRGHLRAVVYGMLGRSTRRTTPFGKSGSASAARTPAASRNPRWVVDDRASFFAFTISRGKIVEVDILADPERLRQLVLIVLDE
jgi:hypothetical protein